MNQFSNGSTANLYLRTSSLSNTATLDALPTFYNNQTTSGDTFPVLESKSKEPVLIMIKDKRWAGLYVHSFVMGFVTTALPLMIYPFFTGYLNMEGTQTLSVRALLAIPWVLRPLFRILAASLPGSEVWRYRRCLAVGWTVANIALTVISFMETKEPYFPRDKLDPQPLSQLNATELSLVRTDARGDAGIFVMLMTVSVIGLVLADVGGDALIEQVATEHFPALGSGAESVFVQDMTAKRIAGVLSAFVFIGFTMNGEDYGGSFSFSLKFSKIMMVVGFATVPTTPAAQFFISERSPIRSSFRTCAETVWTIFQNRGLGLIIICRFIAGVMRGVSATPGNPIAMYWADVQPINDSIISFVATLSVIGFVRLAEKKNWVLNHVFLIVVANILVLGVDCAITMATIWDVVRSGYLWVGMPLLATVPSVLEHVLVHLIIGQIAEAGHTELTREIVTAVSILATTLGTVATKLLGASFDVFNDDILTDSDHVRSDATTVFLIAYAAQLLSLAWVYVLPRRSEEAREWRMRHNTSSAPVGAALLGLVVVSFFGSIAIHVLSINESTSCQWIAGGKGCD